MSDVEPILAAHCTGCHGPGGQNHNVDLTSYKNLLEKPNGGTSTRAQTAVSFVANCQMPPPPLPRLTSTDIATLYCWASGGYQEK